MKPRRGNLTKRRGYRSSATVSGTRLTTRVIRGSDENRRRLTRSQSSPRHRSGAAVTSSLGKIVSSWLLRGVDIPDRASSIGGRSIPLEILAKVGLPKGQISQSFRTYAV